ncbi:MAG: SUMF1/EgtB/PvdO family nonheme iron enzyme [Muribaculaceae bacterium]|nr:SUMF1/EgtB/PvdO family nonheme iron enzyme [Muribaculaceae bacterium]
MTQNLHKFRWLAAALCLLGGLTASAYDFMADGLAYNILDDHTVEVTSTVSIELDYYQAPDDDEYFGYYTGMWVVDGEGYEIGSNGSANVPTDINYPDLGPAVVIPASVSHQGCQYSVTGISNLAFAFTAITSVEIPASITTIGHSAFQDCNALTAVHVSDIDAWCRIDFKGFYSYEIGNWFESESRTTSTGNPTEYARHLYVNGEELTTVVVPGDVTRLNCTFHNCGSLAEVILPESVTSLGVYTFAGTAVDRLPLTAAMTEIPMGAFSNCSNLAETLCVPSNIVFVRSKAFAGSPIKKLYVPSTMEELCENAFAGTGLTEIYSASNTPSCQICQLWQGHAGDIGGTAYAFDDETMRNATLYVPSGARAAYEVYEIYENENICYWNGWADFQHIEEYAEAVVGDLNGDDLVDVNDLNMIINVMLGFEHNADVMSRADLDGSGGVDVSDMNLLINIILSSSPNNIATYTVNGVSFQMVRVAGGTFTMGATAEQGDTDPWPDESPAHKVTLSSFSIGQTEVTQALWQAVMGSNPSATIGDDNPVESVSWDDCQEFITRLNALTGQHFRLPTEAEWEYAARGGSKSQGTKYAGGDNIDLVAWYASNSGNKSHAVATKTANELGLYDMSGNVSEWCSDYANSYTSEAQTNPTGPETGTNRQWRGGNWRTSARYCRVSNRSGSQPSTTNDYIGLRLAM